MKKAYLLLADGTLFEGTAVGYEGQSIGEVVFNTGMAGYQEVLTDPSYYGQVVTMTYPLIGNYGINFDDYESRKSWVSGFIMREMCEYPSNWRCKVTLDEYLKAQKVVGLAGIDTRRLTRKLRGEGVMNGVIYTEGFEPDEQTIAEMKAYVVRDAVKTVTCDENIVYPADGETKYRIALFDYGVKYNIERELCKRGCEVTVVPAYTKPEDVVGKYDGVMLSNGPGDPAENVEIVANLKELLKSDMPIFGICLGHQLLALAIDGITSLSTKPIRFIVFLGLFIFLCSIGMLIYSLVQHFLGHTSIGWTSLIVSIWAIGGLQLLAIGVIGEYIGKIYLETKARPRYIIEKVLN